MVIYDYLMRASDIIISFFYRIMNLSYSQFYDLITYTNSYEFTSLVYNDTFTLSLPDFGLGNYIIGLVNSFISKLFYPLQPFIELFNNDVSAVPFYMCFLSFFINSLIIVALIKLVSFIIELLPFE